MQMSRSEKIVIFDTTLRDGEQSPGCSMNLEEKLKIFKILEALNVDIVEAGSRAYLGVINRIIRREKQGIKSAPQNNNIHRAPI